MFEALAQGASHPAVAAWLAMGTVAVAAVVVAMAWSVNVRQIRLAEQLARRQFVITGGVPGAKGEIEGGAPGEDVAAVEGTAREGTAREGTARAKKVPPEAIEGPDEVTAGEQSRFRVQPLGPHQVVTWAVGGAGAVSHAPDPAHPGDLLLIADQPGELTLIARIREGLTERRATKTVTAVAEVPDPSPPFTLRLFLHGWGLVVVAVLIVGFAAALDALGNFTSSDFIAVAVPLAALLGVIAVARGSGDSSGRTGNSNGHGTGHSGGHGLGFGKRHGQG
ncbi:MAG: hypothetical protein ABSB59_12155 [Streptosporangiaceae bacterium]